jgi:hypothetical protein
MKYVHTEEVAKIKVLKSAPRDQDIIFTIPKRTIKKIEGQGRKAIIEEALSLNIQNFAEWIAMITAGKLLRLHLWERKEVLAKIEKVFHKVVLEQLVKHARDLEEGKSVRLQTFTYSVDDASGYEPEANGSEATTPQ